MSTKHTIKHGTGFHLYTSDMGEEDGMLYLELTDCDFATFREGGKSGVTVKLSEDMARKLGLKAVWRRRGRDDEQR